MKRSRVFVRGVGAISGLGDTWTATAAELAKGNRAIAPVVSFDAEGFSCRVASEIALPSHGGDRRQQLALHATREAWQASGADVGSRVGVFVGAESGRVSFATLIGLARAAGGGQHFDHGRFGVAARRFADTLAAAAVSPAAVASIIAGSVAASGPVETVCLACASGSAAIAEATRAIRAGDCDVAICGGVGADVDPMVFAGFALLDALSRREVSRPFDLLRDGFVVGEGAAIIILSRERGEATVEVMGVGLSLDAWRITAPEPEGTGAERAMRAALRDAGVQAVDYVQAHGTSTPLNDAMEARALRRALPGGEEAPLVSSVKGALGHWIAGSGALGFLCAYEAVRSGRVFPTAGLERADPDCPLRHVMGAAVHADVQRAMVNAFAFGGANCSVVVGRCP